VIVSEDAIGVLPLRIVVPLTEWRERYEIAPWLVRIEPDGDNNLAKPSAADAFQIRSVSQTRFASLVGQIWPTDLEAIITAVRLVVGAS
jgi:mRNA interferase MazF